MSQERAPGDVARVVAYVEWSDAGIAATGWDQREDVLREAAEITTTVIRSAGLLLEQTPELVVLACGFNPNNDDVNLVMAIPRAYITRMDVWQPDGQRINPVTLDYFEQMLVQEVAPWLREKGMADWPIVIERDTASIVAAARSQ